MNFEDLWMQKWNIPTDRAQRRDEKKENICLAIMFTSRVMVIKMSVKNSSFSVFSVYDSKKLVKNWAKYLRATERSYRVLSENGMVSRLWNYRSWDIVGRN